MDPLSHLASATTTFENVVLCGFLPRHRSTGCMWNSTPDGQRMQNYDGRNMWNEPLSIIEVGAGSDAGQSSSVFPVPCTLVTDSGGCHLENKQGPEHAVCLTGVCFLSTKLSLSSAFPFACLSWLCGYLWILEGIFRSKLGLVLIYLDLMFSQLQLHFSKPT